MINIKSNADTSVTLTFKGEQIVINPKEVIKVDEVTAQFVLDTLGFCEVVGKETVKEEVSVPSIEEVIKDETVEPTVKEEVTAKKATK
jgi:hypothetical protein